MSRRHLALASCLLALAGCGDAPRAATGTPPPQHLEGMPAEGASPAAAAEAAPEPVQTEPSPPLDERYAQEHDQWRLSMALELPGLPGTSARKIRHACVVWLFQGFAPPAAEGFDAAAKAAHDRLAQESPVPADTASKPWYDERSVTGTTIGPWLSLSRNMNSFGGGAHPNTRVDGLIVEVATARALMLDEIVPAERQAGLRTALATAIRTAKGIAGDAPLTNDIQHDADLPIPVPLLDKDGARFVWNRFDIGAYADGEFTATLPAAQAAGFFALDPWK